MTYRATYQTRNNNYTVTFNLPDIDKDLCRYAAYHHLRSTCGLRHLKQDYVVVTACPPR
jgi:hypothetical protein